MATAASLATLLASNLRLQATAVDLSPNMLHLLRQRCRPTASRLTTHRADALSFVCQPNTARQPNTKDPYDLVVTHFFLDCLTQPQIEALATALSPQLAPEALWLLSDFRIPPGPLAWPARLLVRTLYFAFRLLTGLRVTRLPDHAAALRRAGFTRLHRHTSLAGLLTSELWRRALAP